MTSAAAALWWYGAFRAVTLGLIAGNTVWFVVAGPWSKGLDSLAWFVLLECELRYPHAVARRRQAFTITAVVLYAGIAALIPLWALRGEWFDAYDAVLWLLSFWFIEMDVLKFSR